MTRTSKYLNQDTIAALQSFQIEKIDREITDYLDTNNKMNELILDTLNGVSLKETAVKINVNERNVFNMRHKLLVSLKTEEHPK